MRTNHKIRIKFVSAPEELLKVFRFRYSIYVDEMGRKQKYADHGLKLIIDPLDDGAYLLAAFDEDRVVGTVRVNMAADSNLGSYEHFYGLSCVGEDHPNYTSICTRLMIAKSHRRSLLGYRLAITCLELGLTKGLKWSFLDCNDHLVPFFTRLGCQKYIGKANHEEYGYVTPMRFSLCDHTFLQCIRSPFLRSIRDYDLARSNRAFFESMGFQGYEDAPQVRLQNA